MRKILFCLFFYSAYAKAQPFQIEKVALLQTINQFNEVIVNEIKYHDQYIYITGNFQGMIVMNNDTMIVNDTVQDGFIAKLDTNLSLVWFFKTGVLDYCYGQRLAIDHDGFIYCGFNVYNEGMVLDGDTQAQACNIDLYLLKLSEEGDLLWYQRSLGDTAYAYLSSVTIDPSGNVLVLADIGGDLIFDSVSAPSVSPAWVLRCRGHGGK